MMIFIGADHRGFQQKEELTEWLRSKGYQVTDLGNKKYDQEDDYTDIAIHLGEKVAHEKAKGILICGSGIGVSAAVNKVKGIRAGLCMSAEQAKDGRHDDDMNVLCLSGNLKTIEENEEIAESFCETMFGSDERFIRRINKIKAYENGYYAGQAKNKLKSAKEVPNDSVVILRMDTDLPIEDGKILDNSRLVKSISTIQFLLEKGCKLIILGHRGRPEGKDPNFSLKPVYEELMKLLDQAKVLATSEFVKDVNKTDDIRIGLKGSQIIFVENLRYWNEEDNNDSHFLDNIVKLSDAYVDEAFAVAHRANTSITLFKRMPGFYGFSFMEEAEKIGEILHQPKRPVTVVLGGAKKDKLSYLPELLKKADYVLIGGKLPKLLEGDLQKLAYGDRRVMVGDFNKSGFDISDETIKKFRDVIDRSQTIIWAGAMGLYEDEKERKGTEEIAKAIAQAKAYKIIAGGDTGASVANLGLKNKIDFVCSGGGVMLEYLTKGKLAAWD
ncbi:MAG TPA: phosphoglycerate kinase [Patescibacteria group bacterium]